MGFFGKIKNAFKEKRERKLAEERKAMRKLRNRVKSVMEESKMKPKTYLPVPEVDVRTRRKALTKYTTLGVGVEKKKNVRKKKEEKQDIFNKRFETLKDGTKAMVVDIKDIDTAKLMLNPLGMEAAKTKGVTMLAVKVGNREVSKYILYEHPEAKPLIRPGGYPYVFLKVPNHYKGKVLNSVKKKKSK